MILDNTLLFSDQQAITATAVSTNVIDWGAGSVIFGDAAVIPRNLGTGFKLPLLMQVTEAFATLTSLTITLQTDDNSGFSSQATRWTSQAIPVASLVLGVTLALDCLLPTTPERYMRLNYTVGGSNATAGKITAGIVGGVQQWGVTFVM
jgi:hypothetical protein